VTVAAGRSRVTIVVLAGGSATRLPGKLSLPVDGEPMLVRTFKRLAAAGRPILLSARSPLDDTFSGFNDAQVVLDEYDAAGPLGGLVSAAARVSTPLLFAAAGDLPEIDADFIDALEAEYDRVRAGGKAPDAVVPRWPDGKHEPLAALYDARALERAGRAALAAGTRKVMAALDELHVATYPVGAADRTRLANVNTRADYDALERRGGSEALHGKRSETMFRAAAAVIPGGVDSPVRAYRAVGGIPPFIDRGEGSKIYDVDGREYVDYVLSWGPLVLGHTHPSVVGAVERAARAGMSFGAPTGAETDLARLIIDAFPSIEMVRFVSSGTEACMSALRLARAVTGRDTIVKCAGCYHGHADALLVAAGSGALTLGIPGSPGVTKAVAADTIVVPFNDADAIARAFDAHRDRIACVIVEPVAGNMGFVRPKPGYLQRVREIAASNGSLFVLDEVMTGFRVAYGGAQTLFDLRPDLTCLGKVIGGGLPVGAFGGRREIMERLAPSGDVYQAGTLSGNPLAMAAGIATLRELRESGAFAKMEAIGDSLVSGLRDAFARAKVSAHVDRIGSMWGLFFNAEVVTDLASAQRSDTGMFAAFFHAMLERGIYLAPSQFEAAFLSTAHSAGDVAFTLDAARRSLEAIAARSK
jgi:glutamate-1-semialdehyde 2,1-aminomutase